MEKRVIARETFQEAIAALDRVIFVSPIGMERAVRFAYDTLKTAERPSDAVWQVIIPKTEEPDDK